MSVPWLKNFVGWKLSPAEMEKIDRPMLELIIHVTYKTVQAGALLGSVVLGPAYQLVRGPRTLQALSRRFVRAGAIGAIIGIPMGTVATYAKVNGQPEPMITDRCYRLRHNRGQLNTDRMTTVTTVLGGAFMGVPGVVLGIDAGILLSFVYDNIIAPLPPKKA